MDTLLEIIEGIPPAKNLNRLQDVEQNIKAVKAEFVGKPLVCHELVKHIVYLRRNIDVEKNSKAFYAILDKYMDEILEHYNLRWLLSICDTLVDIGDPARSAAAMNLRRNPGHKRPTFDGMIALDMYHGDMMYNLICRMNSVISKDELVNDIWEEIKHRLVDDMSVPTNWLCSVHSNEGQRLFYHDKILG